MRVIFDTNIWVSFLIGKRLSLSQPFFKRPDIELFYCAELEYEYCQKLIPSDSSIRDPKDLYLLSLAETVGADYIVSGDNDVLDLKQHKHTKILTFSELRTLL